jgi:hypothetical protein
LYLRISLFWNMTLHQWIIRSWHFKGLYCLHLQVLTYPRRMIFLLGHFCSEQMD